MPYNFWKLDSDLYAHVKASGRPQGSAHKPLKNCMYPVPVNSCNDATALGVSQSRAQPKTTYYTSASCDPRVKDSFSSSVSSLSSSGTAVAQHDVQSAARQTWRNGSSDLPGHLYALDPQLPRTIRHATDQFPAALLHIHGESQYNVQHHRRWGNTFEQELPSNNFGVSESQTQCLWNDNQGQCGFTADTVTTVLKHISSHHLGEHQESDTQVQCQCRGCLLQRTIRRDTILRHIREIHYGDKFRRKNLP